MNPIAVFDRPKQSGGRRVRGPGLQGSTVGWTERCRLSALTGRSAGSVPSGNAGPCGKCGGRRVRGPGLQGAPWVGRNVVGSVPSQGDLQES